jgi:hypothetical protein
MRDRYAVWRSTFVPLLLPFATLVMAGVAGTAVGGGGVAAGVGVAAGIAAGFAAGVAEIFFLSVGKVVRVFLGFGTSRKQIKS